MPWLLTFFYDSSACSSSFLAVEHKVGPLVDPHVSNHLTWFPSQKKSKHFFKSTVAKKKLSRSEFFP